MSAAHEPLHGIPPSATPVFPRWMVATLVAALLGLLAGGTWFYRVEKSSARQQAKMQFAAIARLKADQIVGWRGRCLDDAAQITESPFLAEGVARFLDDPNTTNAAGLRNRFQSLATHGHYNDVILTDPEGRTRLSLTGNTGTHTGYAAALAVAMRQRQPVFTDLHTETHYPAPHIGVVAPILAGNDQSAPPRAAVVLLIYASRFLYPLIQTWPTPSDTAETLLVRRDGDQVLFLNELRHQPDAALKLRIPLDRTEVPAVMAVLGRQGFVEGRDYRGVQTVAVVLPIPNSPWFMVAKDDAAVVFAGWRFRAALIMALLAALTGGCGAVGLLIWQYHQKAQYRTLYSVEARLRASVERHSVTLQAVGDGIIATDAQGRVELLNPVAEALTGWSQAEAVGRPLEEVFPIINEDTRQDAENPVTKVLRDGLVVGMANHTLLIAKNGIERPIADSAAPIHDDRGNPTGVVLVFRDQSAERRAERLIQTRLTLLEYAAAHTLEELLTKALDAIGALVESPIGFYHFVDADQRTLILQQWSSRTLQEFCQADGNGKHYSIDQAGVWADCLRQKKPVIHNNYAAMPHKKGMPAGHAEVVRELTVPVLWGGRVVAILGVGNKPEDYSDNDVETVAYLADVTWHLVEQKRAEKILHESELRFRTVYDHTPVGIAQASLDFRLQHANPAYCRLLGYSEAELIGKHLRDITHPQDLEANLHEQDRLVRGEIDHYTMEKRFIGKDGQVVHGSMGATLIRDALGNPAYTIGTVVDLTERKRAEEERERLQTQLTQAQKMEAVGRLAGGVAHDFNNMLGVILGYAELTLEGVSPSTPLHDNLTEIVKAAKRSADLTRQLLAFARKQTIAPVVLELNAIVEGMLKMLRRLIGEDIDLAWLPGTGVWSIKMDPSQLDQLLANLCVNARDAIGGVGKITIETDTVTFDEAYCAEHAGFPAGDFVLLGVSDDGCGMDKETRDKLFEPFFTTKGLGKGTGLGLATVYGIVKQNNGFVNVYSEPNQGATFKIYLPRHADEIRESRTESNADIPSGHGETVLIVEDELAILKLSGSMLTRLGYAVLTANTPNEALRLAETHDGAIHLLITDVVMPGMNGRDLADHLHTLHPKLKILFMSGYTANVIAHRGVLDEGVCFMPKPFSMQDLAAKVREALAEG